MKTLSRLIFGASMVMMMASSCSEGANEAPEDIVSRDTLIEILANIHVFESANQIAMDHSKFEFNLYLSYKSVFEKYEVTEGRFRESLNYYSSDPKQLELIYDDVIIRISEIQAELSS